MLINKTIVESKKDATRLLKLVENLVIEFGENA